MEDHNHLPEHLDDPPPRRNDREAAGPEGENNAAGQNEEHIAVHDGAHELDYLDPLIGDFDAPHLHFQSRSAINPTRPQHESFKISPQLINLVKENQFHGFATEIPIAHIDLFEEICDTTSSDEEANNYRKYTASTGDFATKTVEEARSLISNLAVSDNNNLLDPSLTMDKEAIHLSRFDELMEMMNTAVKCLQEVTSSSSEEDDDFYGREEDVNYMGARRGYQGRVFNQSFRNRGRNTNQKSVNNKIHEMYEEINNKVVTLSDKVEGIYKQNTETAFIVVTFTEPFMRKYKQPLYAHLNAITLRSGLAYKEPIDPRYQEEEQPLPHPRPGRRPVTGEEQPEPALSTRPVTSPVTDGREAAKMPSRPVTQPVTGGDPSDHTGHSTAAGGDVAEEPLNREGVIPTPPLRPERVYQPKVPYPNASKTSKKERERAKLKELIGQLTVRLPFVEACAMIPTLRKYMKSILTNNISLEDGVMMITQDCSAILQNRSPQKRVEEATNELCEEIILDDPLEMALTEAKDDYVFLMESVENSAEILDSAECYTRLVAYLDLDEESSQPAPPKDTPSDVANRWSELRAPKVELKQLPIGLRDRKGADNGVADHLSRMRIDEPIPLDDSLPEENVYVIDTVPIGGVPAPPQQRVARFKSYDTPWFRYYANYLAADVRLKPYFPQIGKDAVPTVPTNVPYRSCPAVNQQPLPNTIRNRTDGDLHQLTLRPASKPRPATHISFRLVIRTVTGALMEKKLASRPTQGKDARAIGFEHLRRIEFLEHGMVGEFYHYRFEHPLSKTANILLPCPEATSILAGENIDFEPAFEDLYIEFTQPMEEDAPAPDPAEDEIDDMDVDRDEEYDTSMYHFGEHVPPSRESKSLSEAHRHNSQLQKWCKK
ncbi:unnamed protein product [Arabidopsis arenosa]|uniref:Arabidopsis retrotransposon Orf1 C-terminal domain-containing protein n=1 Tax=Arabidopsis arenosa TaxID=38785 RepID=A0A8S2A546_ARAAE|nr:unnamed protein product [Arabidopsis arenosa]